MTLFWNRIAIWSLLHELVWISGSSRKLVFELPMYRVHSEHGFGLGPSVLLSVRTVRANLQRCSTQPYIHEYTIQTYIHDYSHIPKYTHVQVYTRTHTQYIHVHTLIYVHIYTCTCMHSSMHTDYTTHILSHPHNHTRTHTHIHNAHN